MDVGVSLPVESDAGVRRRTSMMIVMLTAIVINKERRTMPDDQRYAAVARPKRKLPPRRRHKLPSAVQPGGEDMNPAFDLRGSRGWSTRC